MRNEFDPHWVLIIKAHITNLAMCVSIRSFGVGKRLSSFNNYWLTDLSVYRSDKSFNQKVYLAHPSRKVAADPPHHHLYSINFYFWWKGKFLGIRKKENVTKKKKVGRFCYLKRKQVSERLDASQYRIRIQQHNTHMAINIGLSICTD